MDKFEHLSLPDPMHELPRKKNPGGKGYSSVERNFEEFQEGKLKQIDNLKRRYILKKNKIGDYLDPNLIFKIEVNQKVPDKKFREDLARAGIQILNSAINESDYWIAFTDDIEFKKFKEKLEEHVTEDKQKFFRAIEDLKPIPAEDKIGKLLQNKPFKNGDINVIDFEIWRMEDNRLKDFLEYLERNIIRSNGFKILDKIQTINFCMIRTRINKKIFDEIMDFDEIASADRPPEIELASLLSPNIQTIKIDGPPSNNAFAIAIIDSGIIKHPILSNAIKKSIKLNEDEDNTDESGHGTTVSSIALYGDLHECIKKRRFNQEIWLYSAKILFADNGKYKTNQHEFLENRIKKIVETIISKDPRCKVFNLSIGNPANIMFKERRQFNLAVFIDELSKEYNVIFVISSGNNFITVDEIYPDYFLEDNDTCKIIDPASSALSLTVGGLVNKIPKQKGIDMPSPITRIGPGYKGMIKPEMVEHSGGSFGSQENVIVANPDYMKEGRLFRLSLGTSLSAPKISHYLAKLFNKYPNYSVNLIKALLLSSTSIPIERPPILSQINYEVPDEKLLNLLNIYGYGKPNIEKALFSENNRVLLIKENKIRINNFHLYSIDLPKEFFNEGTKIISVTLVFDPPIRKTRVNYLGVIMEAKLFKNISIFELQNFFSDKEFAKKFPDISDVSKYEISLKPGINLRKKGVHQKGLRIFQNIDNISMDFPLVLAVFSKDQGWLNDDKYIQDYAVVVTLEHYERINLYNSIRLKTREKIRIR